MTKARAGRMAAERILVDVQSLNRESGSFGKPELQAVFREQTAFQICGLLFSDGASRTIQMTFLNSEAKRQALGRSAGSFPFKG